MAQLREAELVETELGSADRTGPDCFGRVASRLAQTRDRLVHHYFDINLDVLWSTVTEDLPALLGSLEEPRPKIDH